MNVPPRLAPLAVLLLASVPAAAQGPPAPERWSPLGPTGGTISALAVAPSNRRTLYAGTESGGFFRSEDGGARWTDAGSGLPGVAVTDIEVDPRAPATLYATSCEFQIEPPFSAGGILKSRDGGRTWTEIEFFFPAECQSTDLALDPRAPDTVFAATPNGLYQSADGGTTWVANPGISHEISQHAVPAVTFDPFTPGTLYILQSQVGLRKSTDGGASWTTLNAGLPPPDHLAGLEIDPRARGTLYVRTVDVPGAPDPPLDPTVASVYRSDDGGATWAPAAEGLGGRRVRDLAAGRGARALYAAAADGVFRSQDCGRQWTGPLPGTADARVVAAPQSPIVYAGAHLRGVLKSFDRGASWRAANRGLHGIWVFELAIAPSHPAVLYATVLGLGVQRSDDGGATWRPADGGLPVEPNLLAVDPRDPATVFAGTIGQLWKTADGGASWRLTTGPETACLLPRDIVFDPRRRLDVYAAGSGFSCRPGSCHGFKSTDGGESWTCMEELSQNVLALAIDPQNPAALYAAGSSRVQATGDAGRTWSDAGQGLPPILVQSLALSPTAPDTLFAGTSAGLYRRLGGIWTPFQQALFPRWTELVAAPSNPAVLYALDGIPGTLTGTRLYRSLDTGQTWREVTQEGLPGRFEIDTVTVHPTRPRVVYTLARGVIHRLSPTPAAP